jgi:hypothetical protein
MLGNRPVQALRVGIPRSGKMEETRASKRYHGLARLSTHTTERKKRGQQGPKTITNSGLWDG